MADLCCEYELAGLTINDQTAPDRLVLVADGIVGLDGAPIRRQTDPKGKTSGGLLHTAHFAARLVAFKGVLKIESVPMGETPAYFAAVYALEQAWIAALEAALNSDLTLAWTPAGSTAHTLTVRYGVEGQEIRFPGSMMTKQFEFSVLAANPTIAVA